MIKAPAARAGRRIRLRTYVFFMALFALLLLGTHAVLLATPFYWDEVGQFIPAALDLWRDGAWVPHSVVPNAHPPGVMAYLAAVWSVFGYSVVATRAAMLAIAVLVVFCGFLLAIELGRNAPGAPAFAAAAFLCVSPLFFSQAVMAQLDMPAMLFTAAALLFFLQERLALAAAACVALVMVKETGVLVPVVLGGWLLFERRRREAAVFALPLLPLAAWFGVLHAATGQPFGDAGFAYYNLLYPVHPIRLPVAFFRRFNYLFVSDFHWVGAAAVVYAWRRTPLFRNRAWKVAWLLMAVHVAGVTVAGGAVLERYLLPVLPVLYAAFASALMFWPARLRTAAIAVLAAGLAAANFWNPPYPFPPEDNLAWTDFVHVQRAAAGFLENRYPTAPVAAAWPLAPVLSNPEFGYVARPLTVKPLPDQAPETVEAIDWSGAPVLALFSHTWDPAWNYYHLPPVRRAWIRFWNHREDITPLDVQAHLPLQPVARFSEGGWWVEIYEWEGRTRGPAPR